MIHVTPVDMLSSLASRPSQTRVVTSCRIPEEQPMGGEAEAVGGASPCPLADTELRCNSTPLN